MTVNIEHMMIINVEHKKYNVHKHGTKHIMIINIEYRTYNVHKHRT